VFYFASSVAFGFYILKDKEYFPKSLGGNGVLKKGFDNPTTPFQDPNLKLYGLITCGFHV